MENQINEQEFIQLIHQYERVIYKVASFYVDAYTPLNDLYQEIVLNLWKSYPAFRGDSKHSTWIYKIALNTCVSFFRRKKNTPVYIEITKDVAAEQNNDEDIKELYALINRLGRLERALILLWLDEKPYQEIAEITGLTVNNVAIKLNRIKSKLKQMSNN